VNILRLPEAVKPESLKGDSMPKLTPEEVKRDVIMRFVVTQDERKEIKAAANKAGMGVSPWLRSLALKMARAKGGRTMNKIEPMTPEWFEARMRQIDIDCAGNEEQMHIEADNLMCTLLQQLGYSAGVSVFDAMRKWYA
jgi:hypothetical protein